MLQTDIKFIAGFANKKSLRGFGIAEVALLGKSNVGKSSLLNQLCNKKNLARVSKTPGCTQQINFFSVDSKFIITDLPGYGFAKVSKGVQNNWQDLITSYLADNKNLVQIILLIDGRRGIKENDLSVMELIRDCGKQFDLVFTKTDKILESDVIRLEEQAAEVANYYLCSPQVFFTSNKEKSGVQKLRNYIFNTLPKTRNAE